jgi:tetratricopeptide (TPR) repeat protein
VFAAIGAILLASPASPNPRRPGTAASARTAGPTERVAACTGVIEAKSETGARLAAAYCNRGHGLTEQRELDRALADLDEAIRIDPAYACSYSNRGRVHAFKQDYDRAIADYSEAIRINPQFALAYNNRGDAWRHKGDHDRAIADFDEAIRLNPSFALAYGNRGDSWHQKKDFARAIEDFSARSGSRRACSPISRVATPIATPNSSSAPQRTIRPPSGSRPTMRAAGATAA